MLNVDSRYAKKKIPWRIIEEEGILVDVDKGEVIHLNPVGASIWNLLDGKKTVTEIIEQIRKEYDIDESTAQKDVFDFIEKLKEKGVIECQA